MNNLKAAGVMAVCGGLYVAMIGGVYLVGTGIEKVSEKIDAIKETHEINKGIPKQFKGKKIKNIHRWQYQAV